MRGLREIALGWRRLATLAVALAAVCVLALIAVLARHPLAASPLLTARLDPPGGETVLQGSSLYVATLDRARPRVMLTPLNAGPADARRRTLWLVPKGGPPMLIGDLKRDAPSELPLPGEAARRAAAGATLSVTLEPPGAPGRTPGPAIASGVLSGG